jgi:UDP-N-acetyl-D-glucosamine dehydrogenase
MSDIAVIIGLGYVGLPLAREATRSGLKVIGLDLNDEIVADLEAGRSHIDDLTDDDVIEMRRSGFRATTDSRVIAQAGAVVICVPTPLAEGGSPDLTAVIAAAQSIAAQLQPGTLVSLESTTYPGTTDELVRPILESTGLVAGVDFNLAFSPERIDPGNEQFGPRNTPKVVGGHTENCTQAAADFYGKFVDTVVKTRGTREAEMAKLLENTYRHINIALVNEMARFCHDLDIDLWDVIGAASTKPFGFQSFRHGPGVGGHCIPIDPNYLSHNVRTKLGYSFRFVELAQEINNSMPAYVARRVQDLLNRQSKAVRGALVLLLGVTYKPNIADVRESPAAPLAKCLITAGAKVSFHDPHVKNWAVAGQDLTSESDLYGAVAEADVCVLLQNHTDYDVDELAICSRQFLDTRGVTRRAATVERL